MRWQQENKLEETDERSRGGLIMPGKKWRLFNFIVEVAVESPKTVDEEEAAEDAADFMSSMSRAAGRVNESYTSITRIDEYGAKRPKGAIVVQREYPKGQEAKLELPRGIETKEQYDKLVKAKPIKAKKKKKISRT